MQHSRKTLTHSENSHKKHSNKILLYQTPRWLTEANHNYTQNYTAANHKHQNGKRTKSKCNAAVNHCTLQQNTSITQRIRSSKPLVYTENTQKPNGSKLTLRCHTAENHKRGHKIDATANN